MSVIYAELDGPSKTIVVEPLESPSPAHAPLPEHEPAYEPIHQPEKVPA